MGSVIGEVAKDVNVVNKEFEVIYIPGEYIGQLGEVFPLVNIPEFEGGPRDIVTEETCGFLVLYFTGHECEPPFPAAAEFVAVNKGESLMIKG